MGTLTRTGLRVRLAVAVLCCAGWFAYAYGAERGSVTQLKFDLYDSTGRLVKSSDYLGSPVVIDFGSCWCGGCQSDAPHIGELAEKYGRRGLYVLRSTSGDNDLVATDFQKHYKLGIVNLLDPDRKFEKQYNPNGWPFVIVADRTGKIVYKSNSPIAWDDIDKMVAEMTNEKTGAPAVTVEGIAYAPKTLERSSETQKVRLRERFPCIACADDGSVYLTFTTNAAGSEDVYARVYENGAWSGDTPLAASRADEYYSTVTTGGDSRPHFAWMSNARGKYDIFVAGASKPFKVGSPMQLTQSSDDATRPRMAVGKDGSLWVAYCKWEPWGTRSRDKEIYVRRYKGGKWSSEMQISPTDVPEYEDHFDPWVAPYGDGVIVVWSWDYHEQSGYTDKALTPTIFCRMVGADFKPGKVYLVSGRRIETMPSIDAAPDGTAVCAWESIAWDSARRADRKSVCAWADTGEGGKLVTLAPSRLNICTPAVASNGASVFTVVWAETSNGGTWTLERADFDTSSQAWSASSTIVSTGNPRFPSIDYDSKGSLWVAYSAETADGRKITVERFPPDTPKTAAGN